MHFWVPKPHNNRLSGYKLRRKRYFQLFGFWIASRARSVATQRRTSLDRGKWKNETPGHVDAFGKPSYTPRSGDVPMCGKK